MANAPKFRRLKRVERPQRKELSASERGYDWHWTNFTAPMIRERDEWLCQQCLREGGLAEAMHEMLSRPQNKDGSTREPPVDHIVPGHVCGPDKFHDPSNLETLCEKHNAMKRESDCKKYGPAPR